MTSEHAQPSTGSGLVVTIDGPAGAGKSTVAQRLARRLGFDFLDTGAMYRCVTLAVLRGGVDASDTRAVFALAQQLTIELEADRVRLNGEDVSEAVRTPDVARAIGIVADNQQVRTLLSEQQRRWARGRNVVTEGRDQGTEVFHDSPCKIFLVASREERARRRVCDLAQRGIQADYESVLQQQNTRDREDASRPVGALRRAPDAFEVSTDGMSMDEVVDRLEEMVRECLHNRLPGAVDVSDPAARHGDKPDGEASV